MSKLTAAIELLKKHENAEEEEWFGDLYPTILVLEAAERVDKEGAISTLARLLKFYVENCPDHDLSNELESSLEAGAVREIRSILEALPDPEKEPK